MFRRGLASRLIDHFPKEAQQEIIAQELTLNLPKVELIKGAVPEEWSFKHFHLISQEPRAVLRRLYTLHVPRLPAGKRSEGIHDLLTNLPPTALRAIPRSWSTVLVTSGPGETLKSRRGLSLQDTYEDDCAKLFQEEDA